MASWIGFAAALFSITSFLPQVVRAWRTRETKDLSLATLSLLASGAVLWSVYGVMIDDVPVLVTNVSILVSLVLLLVAKLRFG